MRSSCKLFFICLVYSQWDFNTVVTADQTCGTPQFVYLESEGIIHCNFSEDYFGIYWYNSTDYVGEFPFIKIKSSEKKVPGLITKEFDIYPNGSLVIRKVSFDHASNYTAVKLDSPEEPIIPHFVTVIVQALPTPPYPVIEECNQQAPCVKEVGLRGNLTLSVKGIFPSVDLEWTKFEEDSPITFFRNQQHTTETTDGRFHVSLTSSFYLNRTRGFKTTVACRVIDHTEASKFDLRSQVFLFFTDDVSSCPTVGTATNQYPVIAVVVPVITIAVVAVLAVVVLCKKVSRRIFYTKVKKGPSESEDGETELVLIRETVQEKVEIFKEQLKSAYQENFNGIPVRETIAGQDGARVTGGAVATAKEEILEKVEELRSSDNPVEIERLRPTNARQKNGKNELVMIPLATKFDVSDDTNDTGKMKDSLEVEPKIQQMILKRGSRIVWKTVGSITDFLTKENIASKYIVIEGDFGNETSNISWQLVWEWSQRENSSLATHFDVLISLKLDQISSNRPINSEIKRLLLKADSSITEKDIQTVLSSSHKICLVPDGFNMFAYSDCDNNSDVSKIISREIFNNCTIILTTSCSCVPNDLKEEVTRLRAKDLNESDQEFLIRKEMVLKDTAIGQHIRALVKGNILIKDILKVPFFFAIFLKIISTKTNIPNFPSVTSFFLWILSEIYTHCPENHYGKLESYCKDEISAELDKMAFEALSVKQNRHKTWRKTEICARLGDSAYQFYRDIGILLENVVPQWDPVSAPLMNDEVVVYYERVGFSHLLFSEWYAARHLLNVFAHHDKNHMEEIINILMNKDHWYCIRFLCGIDDNVADEVVKVVDQIVLRILCKLEVEKNGHNADDDIKRWSSQQLSLSTTDSKMQQAATVQLLEIASKQELLDLKLDNCFNSVEGGRLELTSGVQLPVLENLKYLHIIEEGREVTNEEAMGILRFTFKSAKLRDLKFSECILPKTLDGMNGDDFTRTDITVGWNPNTDSSYVLCHYRDIFTWKERRGVKLDDYEYWKLVQEFRKNHRIWNSDLDMYEETIEDIGFL